MAVPRTDPDQPALDPASPFFDVRTTAEADQSELVHEPASHDQVCRMTSASARSAKVSGDEGPTSEPRSAEGPADVFHEQDQVQRVGGAGLELRYQVTVEVAGLFRFGVHEKASTSNPIGQSDEAGEHVL